MEKPSHSKVVVSCCCSFMCCLEAPHKRGNMNRAVGLRGSERFLGSLRGSVRGSPRGLGELVTEWTSQRSPGTLSETLSQSASPGPVAPNLILLQEMQGSREPKAPPLCGSPFYESEELKKAVAVSEEKSQQRSRRRGQFSSSRFPCRKVPKPWQG